jgi:hypothetical protein
VTPEGAGGAPAPAAIAGVVASTVGTQHSPGAAPVVDTGDGRAAPLAADDGPDPTAWDLSDAEAVELVRTHAFATPAGYAFYALDDEVRDFARAVVPTDGLLTLDLHGSPLGFQIDDALISPAQLAGALHTLIEDGTVVLPPGHGIKLLSCDTATGGDEAPAAQLARALGVPVVAPDLPVWTTLDGEELVASPALVDGFIVPTIPPDGAWHRFDPGGAVHPVGPTVDGWLNGPMPRDRDGGQRGRSG